MTAHATWAAWTCTVHLAVRDNRALPQARHAVEAELAAMDRAASRFRADSELSRANAAPGRPHLVSPLLAEAVRVALAAARATGGLVDPTLGRHLAALGYDRSIEAGPWPAPARSLPTAAARPLPTAAPAWQDVDLDGCLLAVPVGAALDLGATAKALTADRAARRAAKLTGSPVLVSVGGDVSVAGGGEPWEVLVTEHPAEPARQAVTTYGGGLATSTTLARRWVADGAELHHLLDPRTGRPVDGPWRTVTVAAASCVAANTASTAALVLGAGAVDWLHRRRLPARLVDLAGRVVRVAGWPEEAAA